MRLDKLIETQLKTSRKQMKRLFLTGQVVVDGVCERRENRNVDSRLHQISVAGKPLFTEEAYYLMNKPAGVVTANHDSEHQTVMDLLRPEDFREALYAVGRLDRDTKGLVLLTDNGQLGYELLHPTKKVAKVYEAWVNEVVTQEDVAAFAAGILFHGGVKCRPARLEILAVDNRTSHVLLTISEGKFHQVKKMFLACGKKVVSLERVALGPLELGNLPVGSYRSLTEAELDRLKPYFR